MLHTVKKCHNNLRDSISKKLESGKSTAVRTSPTSKRGERAAPNQTVQRRYRVVQALLAVTAVALLIFSFVHFGEAPPATTVRRSTFNVEPLNNGLASSMAISPDGKHIAYATREGLWIQYLDQFEPRLVDNTKGARLPFWSPDSAFVGFGIPSGGEADLMKVRVEGGDPTHVCRMPAGGFRGATWSPDGEVIVFSAGMTRVLHEVYASGGEPQEVFPDAEVERIAREAEEALQLGGTIPPLMGYPEFLPKEAGDRVLLVELGFGGRLTMMALNMETGQGEFIRRGGQASVCP